MARHENALGMNNRLPFLRIPPFPRHRASPLAVARQGFVAEAGGNIVEALRSHRVGGNHWGADAALPSGRTVLACSSSAGHAPALMEALRAGGRLACAFTIGHVPGRDEVPALPPGTNPWDACAKAELVVVDGDCELALIAALIGTPVQVVTAGPYADVGTPGRIEQVLIDALRHGWDYRDPFNGTALTVCQAIDLLGRWQPMIRANRRIAQVHGLARWKQITADALLWDGTGPVRHVRNGRLPRDTATGQQALAWVARTAPGVLAALKARNVRIGEIEDGMIRSTGLGANCVPPLSIVVDAAGPHFDPAQPSELEIILQNADIGEAMLARAQAFRHTLVRTGISKYGQDSAHGTALPSRSDAKRQVLVTGQVEDDRSVECGGCGLDNLQLLRRARALEPDARIIFKPHPDVEAGHRKGHVPDKQALELADEIDRSSSIAALLDQVECVHVLTSLAGFEALMRGCDVVTHGVPFYAGWGLTRDMGPVPARRSRGRSLDELVAATLILYPRYLDPVTRLPCEPELLVERIAAGQATVRSPLIRLRELQGRINRLFGQSTSR